ncbi:hypothetical protein [Chromobacterium haemolyticum]|uniref:hypothetical protein n=1 Tax=Chromobacterium haemolyticum TaxID=394935 RepID=UPI00244AC514|nr:hypothetical protein [Chromobacterium haemolyticum]MDH0342809.1 hypothetical protein [Chromobacterium haemolyticum]
MQAAKQNGATGDEDDKSQQSPQRELAGWLGLRLLLQLSQLLSVHGHHALLLLNDNHYYSNVKKTFPLFDLGPVGVWLCFHCSQAKLEHSSSQRSCQFAAFIAVVLVGSASSIGDG